MRNPLAQGTASWAGLGPGQEGAAAQGLPLGGFGHTRDSQQGLWVSLSLLPPSPQGQGQPWQGHRALLALRGHEGHGDTWEGHGGTRAGTR